MRRRSLFFALSGSGLLLCLGCRTSLPHGQAVPEPKFVGKIEPATLTLRPGASAEFKFSAKSSRGDQTFNTVDVNWTLVDTPSYTVGTITNTPGQPPQSMVVRGQFQAAASLPTGVDRVTFKIKASYSPDQLDTTATVTLDVNAPVASPLVTPVEVLSE